ncbi:hypothetical protein HS99_0017865 [Kitasatospora aureofaciens]|uniref:Uncharacterized protein n=1 Tax=Kitasatospora aureofaciens TaxID=1894 RepID=A0A1E7NE55_KITAU|nr:hypothetical protein B6264_30125 [Kitasatospora aureofaciens]OEV38977.1 hypothetical protein HS99_0017865 [Kitasatospora aureofaciens]
MDCIIRPSESFRNAADTFRFSRRDTSPGSASSSSPSRASRVSFVSAPAFALAVCAGPSVSTCRSRVR